MAVTTFETDLIKQSKYIYIYIIYIYICHAGVVFDNVSIIFLLWASSINNKVGFVQLVSLY